MRQDEVEAFTDFFEQKQEILINRWLERMQLTREDPFYDEVIDNLWHIVGMIIAYMRSHNHQDFERITEKTVKERIAADTNLDELVLGVNTGREIVLEAIADSEIPKTVRPTLILKVSRFFDVYLYYTTNVYMKRKEEVINEKNDFIRKIHADRSTILGQAAASFAHEFRNPLTVVKGFITLLEKQVKSNGKINGYFSIIQREMIGLEEKVSDFLCFSKREGLEERKTLIDLDQLLRETLEFLYPRFSSEAVEVVTHIDTAETFVLGIREQLKQVFLNIINNAVEALSLSSGRKQITITTRASNNKICVSIANNGSRITPQVLEYIFEPFVTTKETWTGLGLSICKQIVEKHGGSIKVTSSEKQTAFYIELKQERGDLFSKFNG